VVGEEREGVYGKKESEKKKSTGKNLDRNKTTE